MSDLFLTGLSGPSVSVSADDGVSNGSDVLNVTPMAETPSSSQYYLSNTSAISEPWEGVAVNSFGEDGPGTASCPMVWRRKGVVASDHPNRIYTDNRQGFWVHAFNDKFYTDLIAKTGNAYVSVYRVETIGGTRRLRHVRKSRVIDADWRTIEMISDSNKVITGPSFDYQFSALYRKNWTYWFGVSAVDTDGKIGPIRWSAYDHTSGSSGGEDAPTVAAKTLVSGGDLIVASVSVALKAGTTGVVTVTPTVDAEQAGYAGWVVYRCAVDPTGVEHTRWVDLENDGGAPVQQGDVFIFTTTVTNPSPAMVSAWSYEDDGILKDLAGGVLGGNSHAAVLKNSALHCSYLPSDVAEVGEYKFRIETDTGDAFSWSRAWNDSPEQAYRTVILTGEQYRFKMRVRASAAANVTLRTGMRVSGSEGNTGHPVTIAVTSTWQEWDSGPITQNFLTPHTNNFWRIDCPATAPGWWLEVEDFEIIKEGEARWDFAPNIAAALVPGMVDRQHVWIKSGSSTWTAEALTSRPGKRKPNASIDALYSRDLALGLRPHVQFDYFLDPDEIDYLAAYHHAPISSEHPAALKRAGHGQIAPWLDMFADWRIEIGNEMWQSGALEGEFWTVPQGNVVDRSTGAAIGKAELTGLWQEFFIQRWKSNPWWTGADDARIEWVFAGHLSTNFGAVVAAAAPSLQTISAADYNGGWDTGSTLVGLGGDSYQRVLFAPAGSYHALRARRAELSALPGPTRRMGIYEAGPGYQLNGLNGAKVSPQQVIDQEVVMRSRAAGTATLDAFLGHAVVGGSRQSNFFGLKRGNGFSIGAPAAHGGGISPAYQLGALLPALEIGRAIVRSLTPLRTMSRTDGATSYDPLGVYALESLDHPGRVALALVNRTINASDLDEGDPLYQAGTTGAILPMIATKYTACETARVYRNIGNMRQHNRYHAGNRLAVSTDPGYGTGPDAALVAAYKPDPLCVALDITTPVELGPINPSRILFDDAITGEETGLPGGNAVILVLDGVS